MNNKQTFALTVAAWAYVALYALELFFRYS